MVSNFIDSDLAGRESPIGKFPQDLPHGLLTPPERIRELVAQELNKHPPGSVNQEAQDRLLNYSTLGYYFDGCVYEVLFRPTPEGPYVFAVGFDEIFAFEKGMPLEEQLTYDTYQPW